MNKLTEEKKKARKHEYNQRYYQENKEHFAQYRRLKRKQRQAWNKAHIARAKQADINGYNELRIDYASKHRKQVKAEVMTHYSNGTNRCVQCGESRMACLTIDHINGKGRAHLKTISSRAGTPFYSWLRRSNFPKGYQVLCMNCQWVKRVLNNEK